MVNDDNQLLEELAQRLSEALEQRQKDRASSVPKKEEDQTDKQKEELRQMGEPRRDVAVERGTVGSIAPPPIPEEQDHLEKTLEEFLRGLRNAILETKKDKEGKPDGKEPREEPKDTARKSREEAYAGARGALGSISPALGDMMDFGQDLAKMARGLARLTEKKEDEPKETKAKIPPKQETELPKLEVPKQPVSPQATSVPASSSLAAPPLSESRPAPEIPDKEDKVPNIEKGDKQLKAEKEQEEKKKQAREDAYGGTRSVVGAMSPYLGNLMDFAMNVKRMISGFVGMVQKDNMAEEEDDQRLEALSAAANIPAPSMGPQTIPTGPASPRQTAKSSRQTSMARTMMAGGEEEDTQDMEEGTLNLKELAASPREDERVENLPPMSEQFDFDFNVEREENLPDKKSQLDLHRKPVEEEKDLLSRVIDIGLHIVAGGS